MKWAEQVQDRHKWKDIVKKAKTLIRVVAQRRRRNQKRHAHLMFHTIMNVIFISHSQRV